jgi:hypothetical protein
LVLSVCEGSNIGSRGEPELALQRIEAAEALVAEQRIGLVLEP